MVRQLFVSAMVAGLVGMGGCARDARAGATVDLLFVGVNGGAIAATDTVTANVGDTLTMAVLMRNEESLIIAQFGVGYDTDGDDELDIVSVVVWDGVAVAGFEGAMFQPIIPPTIQDPTRIDSFNSAIPPPPAQLLPPFAGAIAAAFPLGYQMGTVTWVVTSGVNTDGTDIMPGFNLQGIRGQAFVGAGGVLINANVHFNGAAVNLPEPGAAALLGSGVVGLVVLGRNRMRH